MITIDGRILDTDARWHQWCKEHGIKDPFQERYDRIKSEWKIVNGVECWEFNSPEDQSWEEEWKKRRDEYLRQMHTFRLWDLHFWMDDWDSFQRMGNSYVDMSIYMPCDLANRQCAMTCAYFLGDCPRQKEELKSPIKGLEGRYEI